MSKDRTNTFETSVISYITYAKIINNLFKYYCNKLIETNSNVTTAWASAVYFHNVVLRKQLVIPTRNNIVQIFQ